jgi:L-seryl-tRNA(Ser) seleniumtransferase
VHPSNYRVVGFTATVEAAELASIAAKGAVPFIFDVGSGRIDDHRDGIFRDEPSVQAAIAHADLVTFSGDKLLGGPQAGCLVGRAELIQRLRRHPLARAVRVDKMQVAALESVLGMHAEGRRGDLPVYMMMEEPTDSVKRRAQQLSEAIGGELEHVNVQRTESVVGGGSLPGVAIASFGVAVRVPDPIAFAGRLRTGSPSVFCRVEEDRVVLDVRTVSPDSVPHLARAVLYALEGNDFVED